MIPLKPGHQMHRYKMGINCLGSSAAEKKIQQVRTQVWCCKWQSTSKNTVKGREGNYVMLLGVDQALNVTQPSGMTGHR